MSRLKIPLLAGAACALAVPVTVAAEPSDGDPAAEPITAGAAAAGFRSVLPSSVAPAPPERIAGVPSDPGLVAGRDGFLVTGVPGRALIHHDPSRGFSLATTAGRLDVAPDDTGVDATAARLVPGADAVVAANTAVASDTLLRPKGGGIETFTRIRGADAPEEYSWVVALPGQEGLRLTGDGGAQVLGPGGRAIATIAPPWGRDAAGNEVETWLSVEGDVLTMHVEHLREGLVYPIVADPEWVPGWVRAAAVVVWTGARTSAKAAGRGARWVVSRGVATGSWVRRNGPTCAQGALTSVSKPRFRSPWLVAIDAGTACVAAVEAGRGRR